MNRVVQPWNAVSYFSISIQSIDLIITGIQCILSYIFQSLFILIYMHRYKNTTAAFASGSVSHFISVPFLCFFFLSSLILNNWFLEFQVEYAFGIHHFDYLIKCVSRIKQAKLENRYLKYMCRFHRNLELVMTQRQQILIFSKTGISRTREQVECLRDFGQWSLSS